MSAENQSIRTLQLGIWGHMSRRRRIQLGLLVVVMLASGGAELVSLVAVVQLANLWLIGSGPMDEAYAAALQALGVLFRVIGRSRASAEAFQKATNLSFHLGWAVG